MDALYVHSSLLYKVLHSYCHMWPSQESHDIKMIIPGSVEEKVETESMWVTHTRLNN